jgi:hypothetical protein
MQLAVACVAVGLLADSGNITAIGAAIGLMGWLALMTALAIARQRAAHA